MRIAQDRPQLGCFWALAAGWAILTWLVPPSGILAREKYFLDVAFITIIVLGAIYFTIERKVYPHSVLVTDAAPEPGHGFRGKIESSLKKAPASGCKVRLEVNYSERKSSRTIWKAEAVAHPIGGEHGLILPVEFSVPAEIARELSTRCSWTVSARANVFPIPYRASFPIAVPIQPAGGGQGAAGGDEK
jgi:hypothetical protein